MSLSQPRTLEERKLEGGEIVRQLTELGLTTEHTGVPQIIGLVADYIERGERIELKVPLPDANRRAVGVLATSRREQVWLKLEMAKDC